MGDKILAGIIVLALVSAGAAGGATNVSESNVETDLSTEADVVELHADGPAGSNAPASQSADCNYTRLFDRVTNSVVTVSASNETGDLWWGSGWVYRIDDSTAYVVTNWHVVHNATEFDVQFGEGRWREAEMVGSDDATDLAVLRVESPPESVEALALADAPPERGQPVAAVGTPADPGLEESIARGIVSGIDRAITIPYPDGVNRTIPDTIQTDAVVAGGNSGGPLVNCEGRVLGVNYAGFVFDDVNFAVSARTVRTVVPSLVENGSYDHSFLGVSAVNVRPSLAGANDLNVTRGVMVVDVLPGGPADGALRGSPAVHRQTGTPYGGDVVLAIDGAPIDDQEDLLSHLLLETRPNETVNVTVLRNGENRTVQVTLGTRPAMPKPPETVTAPSTTTTQLTTTAEPPTTESTITAVPANATTENS